MSLRERLKDSSLFREQAFSGGAWVDAAAGATLAVVEPPLYLIQTVFDEGITVIGDLLVETNALLREVHQAIAHTLYKELQAGPKAFDLRIDSEAARAARNMSPRSGASRRDHLGRGDPE